MKVKSQKKKSRLTVEKLRVAIQSLLEEASPVVVASLVYEHRIQELKLRLQKICRHPRTFVVSISRAGKARTSYKCSRCGCDGVSINAGKAIVWEPQVQV